MTNSPGTSTPNNLNAKATPPEIDVTPRSMIVGPATSRGFGGPAHHEQKRYYDIFDDTLDSGVGNDFNYQTSRLGGMVDDRQPSYPRPFSFGPGLEGDTFFVLHHRKGQGIQIVVQAGTRVFIVAMVILILLISSPGIRDTLDSVIKAILNLH